MFKFGKKKQETIDNAFDLDSDLDLGNFEFDEPTLKDDRKPVAKVASGFIDGAKSTVKDTAFLRAVIKDTFPRGFGDTVDLSGKVSEGVRSLYDESAKEIKPAIKEFKRVSSKLIPADAKMLPKSVSAMLKRWKEEQEGSKDNSKEDQRESFIGLQLSEAFKEQFVQDQKRKAEDDGKDRLQQGLELNRHRDVYGALLGIDRSVSRMMQYQGTINLQYQKKSLEVGYRQLFALQDLVAAVNKSYVLHSTEIPAIRKNTALPDYVKLTSGEFVTEINKRKFIDNVSRGLFGNQVEYIEKVISGVKKKFIDQVKESTNDFKMALMGAEQAKEMMPDDDMGPSKEELAGNVVGGIATDSLGRSGGRWLRKNVIDKNAKIKKVGTFLERKVENAPRALNEFRKDSKYQYETGPMAWLARTIQQYIPSASPDIKFDKMTFKTLDNPSQFTNRTNKSINEIIPGYLARILREVQIFRTGNEKIELTQFDYNEDRFSTRTKVANRLLKQIVKPKDIKNTQGNLDKILAEIDPEGKLSEDAKKILKKQLLMNSTDLNEGSVANLGNSFKYNATSKEGKRAAEEAASFMTDYLGSASEDEVLSFQKKHNALSEYFADPRSTMETFTKLGQTDLMKQLGLLDQSGMYLDMNKLVSYHAGETDLRVKSNTHGKRKPGIPGMMDPSQPRYSEDSVGQSSALSDRSEMSQELQKLLEDNLSTVNSSIQLGNAKLDTNNAHLKTIEDLVKAGMTVNLNRTSTRFNSDINFESFSYAKFKEYFKRKKNAEQSGEESEETPNFGKGISGLLAKMTYGSSKMIGNAGKKVYGVAKSMAKFNMSILKASGNRLLDRTIFAIEDVYVEGEEKPRIYAARIRAGVYVRKSDGKPLTTSKEIDGPILDNEGNYVINEEDLNKLYTKDLFGNAKKLLGKGFSLFKNGIFGLAKRVIPFSKNLRNIVQLTAKTALTTLTNSVKGAWNLLDQPIDIYIPGIENPVMLAVVMKNGGYFSKITKKPILKPSQIDGPVVDIDGNEVLSLEMLRKGAMNIYGKKIKLPLDKILGVVKGIFNTGVGIAKSAWNTTKRIGKGILNSAKGLFNGFSLEINGKRSVTILEEIRDILLAKFGKAKKVIGDTDGDGEREGSWQQLKRKSKDKYNSAKDKAKGFFTPKDKPKAAGGLFDGLKGLTDGIGGLVKGVTGLFSLGKAGGLAATGSKVLGGLMTAGKAGLALLPGLGGLFGAGAATAATATAATAATATGATAATAAAGTALASTGAVAGTGILGAIGGTLATVGAGILSFLSSPVVLGVAAVALVGYGAYKAYQYFKKKLEPIDKLRLVQYGFNSEDNDNFAKLRQLEDYLKDFTQHGPNGMVINEKALSIKKLMAPFGLDHTSKDQLTDFFKWYQNRFKPVYLTQCASLLQVKQILDLGKLNSLKGKALSDYFNLAKFPEGPYENKYLPFKDEKYKVTGKEEVIAITKKLAMELKITETTAEKTMATIGVTKNEDETPIQNNAEALTDTSKLEEKWNPNKKKSGSKIDSGLPNTPGARPGGRYIEDDSVPVMGVKSGGTTIVSAVNLGAIKQEGDLTAIEAIKFKIYGLVKLDVSKVKAIQALEMYVAKKIKTLNGQTEWKGEPLDALKATMGQFGILDIVGRDANNWLMWFKKRFMTTFLDYVTYYVETTGRKEYDGQISLLKVGQQLELAKLISAVSNIWKMDATPFPSYALNTDPESIKGNIKFLQDVTKEETFRDDNKANVVPITTSSPTQVKSESVKSVPNSETGSLKGSGPAAVQKEAPPDAEGKPTKTATIVQSDKATNPNDLKMADGIMSDGRNGFDAINLAKGVNLERLNPAMLKNIYGMAEEYKQLTGKNLTITDAFRSYEDQVAMKKKYGARAATPGKSLHEFGLALDADSKQLEEMDQLGLMRKYGFIRPVGGEPWHVEPAGIQLDIDKYKQNFSAAVAAIEAGVGRGGSGLGAIPNSPKYTRNRDLSAKILMSAIPPNVKIKKAEDTTLASNGVNPSAATNTNTASSASIPGARPGGKYTDAGKVPAAVGSIGSMAGGTSSMTVAAGAADGEAKQKVSFTPGYAGSIDKTKTMRGGQLAGNVSTLPSNPGIKISEPRGDIQSIKQTVEEAAKMVGVDPNIAVSTVAVESGFNPSAKAKTSSASGLYQFIKSTWDEIVGKYGSKYGMTAKSADPLDARTSAIMGAHFIKDNVSSLGGKIGGPVGPTETYLAHFLGTGGASTFLKAMKKNPDAIAADIMPDAAGSNKSIFYNNGQPRTLKQVYDLMDQKVKTKAASFGISLPNTQTGPKLPTIQNEATATATPPAILGNTPKLPNSGDSNVSLPNAPAPRSSGNGGYAGSIAASAPAVPSKATEITNVGRSPMNDAFGFNPNRIQSSAKEAMSKQNNLSIDLKTTEGLLSQSVGIQTEMVTVLKNIFGLMSDAKSQTDASKQSPSTGNKGGVYSPPKIPVSMAKTA